MKISDASKLYPYNRLNIQMTYLSLQRQAQKLLAIKTMLTKLVKQNSINLQREFWVKDRENSAFMASVEHRDMM